MKREEFPSLSTLFGAYLHQDWDIDYQTPENAVRAFAADATPPMVSQARREITLLLGRSLTDSELATLITREFGASYDPRLEGHSPRAWLPSVAAILDPGSRVLPEEGEQSQKP